MAKELDLQTKIIHSVRKDHGHARKLSNKFTIGIPDLLIALHPFALCLAEVKDLGPCVDKFDRQVEVTPKQGLEMSLFDRVYREVQTVYTPSRRASLVLVGLVHRGEHRLVALSSDARRLDYSYECEPARWVERQVGGYYDIRPLLEWAGVCKVKLL